MGLTVGEFPRPKFFPNLRARALGASLELGQNRSASIGLAGGQPDIAVVDSPVEAAVGVGEVADVMAVEVAREVWRTVVRGLEVNTRFCPGCWLVVSTFSGY